MTKPCRYVRDYGHFLRSHVPFCKDRTCEGCQPCTHDDQGNLVRHCDARKSCGQHLDPGHPRTCPKCVSQVRADLRAIKRLSLVLEPLAAEMGFARGRSGGVNHQAASVAGPAADPVAWTSHRMAQIRAVQGNGFDDSRLLDGKVLDPEDRYHPEAVLSRWELMIREHYQHRPTRRPGVVTATDYLSKLLTKIAQDEGVDWATFGSELRICRSHLEDLLNTSRRPVTGAPCPSCSTAPPLRKVYAHWCERAECERVHDTTGDSDVWRCPKCRAQWTENDYRKWVANDYLENTDAWTAKDLEMVYGIVPSSLRTWAERGLVKKAGRNASGQRLYDVDEAVAAHRAAAEAKARGEATA